MVEGKTQTIFFKNRQRTKHTGDAFDQWPQLRGNGFHIVTTWHLFANTPPVQRPPSLFFCRGAVINVERRVPLYTHIHTHVDTQNTISL